jgi:hypothetical protein
VAAEEVGSRAEGRLHYREGDVVDPGSVFSGVGAESFERLIDSNLSLGSEHAFGLLNNEPGIQRLLQAFLAVVLQRAHSRCASDGRPGRGS